MISDREIFEQIPYTLTGTNFDFLGQRYEGKVRDNYVVGSKRVLITTDRLSCFDKVVTSIPFKGQVLNCLARFWFDRVSHVIPNHVLESPHPNVLIGREAKVLPVEVVVREYLSGSAWRDYSAGRPVSGVVLPKGLRASERLPAPIITPSTKAERGTHDQPISEKDIIAQGLVSPALWEEMREKSLQLFAVGRAEVAKRGLLLADTKYEFGVVDGALLLVDEIHTLDSSRFWKEDSYSERLERGEPPEMLDKEPVRQWLLAQGFMGDGPVPEFSEAKRVEISRHYISAYELVTGEKFIPTKGETLPALHAALETWLGRSK